METIKNYLDNMFAGLPKTARVTDLKNNILSNMEEKYNELKHQGKSENEAIGIVISEFGNIEELINELGIRRDETIANQPIVTKEEVEAYQAMKKSVGLRVAIGVFLCILSPAFLILTSCMIEDGYILKSYNGDAGLPGIIGLFVMITIAVGIFISTGMQFERYKYIEEGVQIPGSMETELRKRYDRFLPSFYLCVILGVCFIILSPISIFISSLMNDSYGRYGVVILLLIVACAVTLFIYPGTIKESYDRLLKTGDYSVNRVTKSKKEDKVIGAIAAIVWPLAGGIYLICGFIYDLWDKAWIVFPITGILFGMFCAAYSILTDKKNN